MIVLRDVIILYHDESSINADNHDKYDSLFIKIRLFSRTSKLSSYTNEPQNTVDVTNQTSVGLHQNETASPMLQQS